MKAAPLPMSAEIEQRILSRFPFELTPDQRQVCHEIGADLAREVPTNRLLQGDVGAGKTAVAVHAHALGGRPWASVRDHGTDWHSRRATPCLDQPDARGSESPKSAC